MSKKILAVVLAAAMACMGLTGCQSKGTTSAPAGESKAGASAEATKITICVPDPEALIFIRRHRNSQNVRKSIRAAHLHLQFQETAPFTAATRQQESNSFQRVLLIWLSWQLPYTQASTRDST